MRGPSWVVAITVLAMQLTPAAADDREDARKEFTAGQAADKQHDYQGAIEHYLRANDLVPHPFALYNIAADYERLGKLREAATWYQRYVDAAPESADKDKVRHLLGELSTRAGTITIRSIPDGAEVTIDNRRAGKTPYTATVPGGRHHVTVTRGAQREDRDITLEYAEAADVEFTLQGTTGTLVIAGTPIGALVAVDGYTAGAIPANVVLAPGAHSVVVNAYGYSPYQTQATVAADAVTRVDVTMVPSLGSLPVGTETGHLDVGYVIGVNAGTDTRNTSTALFQAEFGARVNQYEGVIRAGSVANTISVDFVVRWAFTRTALAPFVGAGYSYTSGGFGYEAVGGLRLDLARHNRLGVSIISDLGLRYFSGNETSSGATSGTLVPLEISLDLIYR